MKRFLTTIVMILSYHLLIAQTNPTPWILKDADYTFLKFNSAATTTYPSSIQGWQATFGELATEPPIDNQPTGDAPLCSGCAFSDNRMINERDRGISMKADGGGVSNDPCMFGLALNTTDCYGINIAWIGRQFSYVSITGLEHVPSEYLAMQYRIGESGDWNNLADQVYFMNNSLDFLDVTFYTQLPSDADNQSVVQLRWLLYSTDNIATNARMGAYGIVADPDSVTGKTKDYCYASGIGCGGSGTNTDSDHITSVVIEGDNNGINNPSSCDTYGDYTNMVSNMTIGNSYRTSINVNAAGPLSKVGIWVDWNNDKDFEDEGEFIGTQNANPGVGVSNFEFTITPPAIASGNCRMRIRSTEVEQPATACGSQPFGEVEDYTLNVISPASVVIPECPNLTSPADGASNLCTESAAFTWNASGGDIPADGYNFYLGTDNPPTNIHNGEDKGTSTSHIETTALTPNTTYYWQVKAYNTVGESEGCDIFSFTTAANADPVIDNILIDAADVDSASGCQDEDVFIVANVLNGTGTINYTWSVDDIYLDDNTINNPKFNANTPNQTYKLVLDVSDANQCATKDSILIYVKPLPIGGSLSADKNDICPGGETFTLTHTGTSDNVSDWEKELASSPGFVSIGHTGSSLTTVLFEETTYKVIVVKDGCFSESNEVTVGLHPAPLIPFITANPGLEACEGEEITLSSSAASNNEWNDAAKSVSKEIVVTKNGLFHVIATDPSTGCSAQSEDVSVAFHALPDVNIELDGLICEGETVLLSAQHTDVVWTLPDASTDNNPELGVTASGTYSVSYIDPNTNCGNTDDMEVVFNPKPATPSIEQVGFDMVTNPLQVVDWYDADGNYISTGERITPTIEADQVFTVKVIDDNNCESDVSNAVAFDHTVGIEEFAISQLKVYPNPVVDELSIQITSEHAAGTYLIKDITGRVQMQQELHTGINVISTSRLVSGIYTLQFENGQSMRIVKQ